VPAYPLVGELSGQRIRHQVGPVLTALADVPPGEARDGGPIDGHGESITISCGMAVEEIPAPVFQIAEVAEDGVVTGPDPVGQWPGTLRSG
jgi:hypothetical protein